MNILMSELKANYKSFIGWSAALLCLFGVFFLYFFDVFLNSRAAVEAAMQNLPAAFALIFGVQLNKMFSFGGFYQFIFLYVGLLGAIMAAALAISVFSREKRARCVDFLFAKPVSRGSVFGYKLLCCLGLLLSFNLLYALLTLAAGLPRGVEPGLLLLASLCLLCLQLVFMAIGAFIAVFAKRIRSVSGTATAVGMGGFVAMALHMLLHEDILRYLSPLEYARPGEVLEGTVQREFLFVALLLFLALLAASFWRYTKTDTDAV